MAADKMILRCPDVHSLDFPTVQAVLYMARLVRERTKGRIEIVVYPNGALGSEKSVVNMVRVGALEMGRVSLSEVVNVYPDMEVLSFPYVFRDDSHKWKVLDGDFGRNQLAGLAKIGLIGLCFQESGYRSFYNTKRPIYRPSDLIGLKIRVQPTKIMINLVEVFGAAAVPIDYNEVFSALKGGAVDGAENNLPSYLTSGHYQIARYFSFDRHSSIPEVVILSAKIWDRLSRSDQAVIRNAAQQSVAYQRKLWERYESQSFRALRQAGCQFNEVDLTAFKEACLPFYRKYYPQYQSMVDRINLVQ